MPCSPLSHFPLCVCIELRDSQRTRRREKRKQLQQPASSSTISHQRHSEKSPTQNRTHSTIESADGEKVKVKKKEERLTKRDQPRAFTCITSPLFRATLRSFFLSLPLSKHTHTHSPTLSLPSNYTRRSNAHENSFISSLVLLLLLEPLSAMSDPSCVIQTSCAMERGYELGFVGRCETDEDRAWLRSPAFPSKVGGHPVSQLLCLLHRFFFALCSTDMALSSAMASAVAIAATEAVGGRDSALISHTHVALRFLSDVSIGMAGVRGSACRPCA